MEYSTNYERLITNLKYLNLKQVIIHLENELKDPNISLIDGLLRLTDYEVDNKKIVAQESNGKSSKLSSIKTLKTLILTSMKT